MKRQIIAIGVFSMFLLTSITVVSAFKLEETEVKSKQPLIVAYVEYDAEISLNNVVSFELSVSDFDGEPASFCDYEVYTRPFEEDVSYQRDGDKIIGEFTPTKEGMYSLIVETVGVNKDVEKTIFYYFVNPAGIGRVRYYLRDVNPTHGQPGTGKGEDGDHGDLKALLLAPPSEEEYWDCAVWVQNSPDEVPEDMPLFSILKNIDIYCWYKFDNDDSPFDYGIGIQRFVTLGSFVRKFNSIQPVLNYTWINTAFDVSWAMVRPTSWYRLSLKLIGSGPVWMTKPEQSSFADFSYKYCKKPFIKSNSNPDVTILSATTQVAYSNNAEIVLEGEGTTNLVIQMPDKSKRYSAKLNGVACDFTQMNGELIFDLHLDSEHAEHSLYISPGRSGYGNQQSSNPLFFQILQQLCILIQ